MSQPISIIIPTLDEAARIQSVLRPLVGLDGVEVIVVDGGSQDGTPALAAEAGARVLSSERGRARQMNAGRRAAGGDLLIFLHGDTVPPADFLERARRVVDLPGVAAGAFRLRIDGAGLGFRIIETVANLRSRFLRTPYGDQILFLKADVFDRVGGFPELPIMEDFEFVRRLARLGRIAIAPAAVSTSARRWEKLGLVKTTLLNWAIVLAYLAGVRPERLAAWYGRRRGNNQVPAREAAPETSG